MRTALATLILMAAMPAAAAVPPEGGYRSTTADYTAYRETPTVDWRMANEAMGPMHGHSSHMMGPPAKYVGEKEAERPPAQSGSMGMGGHHHPMGGQP